MDNQIFSISRIESYKFSECGGVLKESHRKLPKYPNSDIDFSRSFDNFFFVNNLLNEDTIENYILRFRDDQNIKGRFNTVSKNPKSLTNVLCQVLFSASPDFFENMSRDDILQYYSTCLNFFLKKFPTVHIVSAVVHFDETTPHLHINFLPIVERENKNGELEKIFSTTKLMPGKNFFSDYQDEFFSFIHNFYSGFCRSRNLEGVEHLTVPEFKKAMRELEKLESRINEIKPISEKIQSIEDIGSKSFLGSSYKLSEDDLNNLKSMSQNYTLLEYDYQQLLEENEKLKTEKDEEHRRFVSVRQQVIEKEKEISRLNRIIQRFNDFIKKFNLVRQFQEFSRVLDMSKIRDKER